MHAGWPSTFRTTCRRYSTAGSSLRSVPVLADLSLLTFRQHAFDPAKPAVLPRGAFVEMPAVKKWFTTFKNSPVLNQAYLSRFGATIVPVEITHKGQFNRIEQSFSFFLECAHAATSTYEPSKSTRYFNAYVPKLTSKGSAKAINFFNTSAPVATPPQPTITKPSARVYLAQCPLSDLPKSLRDDVPAPEIVLSAGRGDIYDSSVWLGQAPTYTPLHRDPNPNLFVQLAGTKLVRLQTPEMGKAVFHAVQEQIGSTGTSPHLRGEEMMQGLERKFLDEAVWGKGHSSTLGGEVFEARLEAGDGLFIPRGWWHSVKGTGNGMTGSVNWWFR